MDSFKRKVLLNSQKRACERFQQTKPSALPVDMSTRVYELTEIMLYITKLSTIESIVTLSHANRLGQAYARETIDGFIQAML